MYQIGMRVGAIAGKVRGGIGEIGFHNCADIVAGISHPLMIPVSPPSPRARPITMIAAYEILFREVDRDAVFDFDITFQWADGCEGPAASASSLVSHRRITAEIAPVE